MGPGDYDDVLREIVRNVEQNSDMDPDHPDLLALKRILLEKISPLGSGDGRVPEIIAYASAAAALPVDVSLGNVQGLSAAEDPAALPTDPVVSQALGLGAATNQTASPGEAADNQTLGRATAPDPPVPSTEGA